ncbi:leukosialin [Hoplias malabaricus]|uniref:leukosialin n=1 Tax=Hoplias malabaricus TaxID=27720 RepID=UPI003461D434
MCGLRFLLSVTFFSLTLGPHVMLLHAQGDQTSSTPPESTGLSTYSKSPVDPIDDGKTINNEAEATNVTHSATEPSQAVTTPRVLTTSTDPETTTSQEPSTTTQLLTVMTTTVHETTSAGVPEISTAMNEVTTKSADSETTASTEELQKTTQVHKEITTMAERPQTPPPVAPTPLPTTVITSMFIPVPTSNTVKPAETTTSARATTHHSIILTTEGDEDLSTAFQTQDTTMLLSPTVMGTESIVESIGTDAESSDSNWLIILVIAAVVIVIVTIPCVVVFVKRRKKRGTQRFGTGYMNGRRSKKKKGEDDAWAGPVNLDEKGMCEDPEDGGQGDDKKADGTDEVLSTFAALDGNPGVGRPGSMEAQKWEEQEPLLYIDEDKKGEVKEKPKEEAEKAKETEQKDKDNKEKTEATEPSVNGGEAFCLTTAV